MSSSSRRKPKKRPRAAFTSPPSAQEKPELYEVVEVGPGGVVDGNEVVMTVNKGETVLVGKYSGTKVKVDEEELTIVRQSDILAVVE